MIKVPAYVVFYHEADRYSCLQCFVEREQAEVLRDIYSTAGLEARIGETEITLDCDSLIEYLERPLFGVYIYSEESGKDAETKRFGVDQMLSYKGYDTRRIFSIAAFGEGCKSDNAYTIFLHATNSEMALEWAFPDVLDIYSEVIGDMEHESEGGDSNAV